MHGHAGVTSRMCHHTLTRSLTHEDTDHVRVLTHAGPTVRPTCLPLRAGATTSTAQHNLTARRRARLHSGRVAYSSHPPRTAERPLSPKHSGPVNPCSARDSVAPLLRDSLSLRPSTRRARTVSWWSSCHRTAYPAGARATHRAGLYISTPAGHVARAGPPAPTSPCNDARGVADSASAAPRPRPRACYRTLSSIRQ